MEKICTICGNHFETERPKLAKCPECKKAYDNAYYEKKKHKYGETRKASRRSYRLKMQTLVWNYLLTHPCVDCGESDPIVLEFDHRDQEDKLLNISYLARYFGEKKIIDEINKCDVRCANCHRRKTAKQLGFKILDFIGCAPE